MKAKILAYAGDKRIQKTMDYSDTDLYEFRTTKQMLPTGHAIFKDTVAFFNWGKKPRVFVMMCQDNADQYRQFFYDVWKKSVYFITPLN